MTLVAVEVCVMTCVGDTGVVIILWVGRCEEGGELLAARLLVKV